MTFNIFWLPLIWQYYEIIFRNLAYCMSKHVVKFIVLYIIITIISYYKIIKISYTKFCNLQLEINLSTIKYFLQQMALFSINLT